jgi:glycosyltransferase involved in cell wall biosynthesis
MLPAVAAHLQKEENVKEGWLSGMAALLLERREENGIELSVAFPVERGMDGFAGVVPVGNGSLSCYGFYEDTSHAERYDRRLEAGMKAILERARPDLVHCFGTEYAHTLAMARVHPAPEKLLVGIQGLCGVYAQAYMADLPQEVQNSATLRDLLRRDSLRRQQRKFAARGRRETEIMRRAGHVTGRTAWDEYYAKKWNPGIRYHFLNETLRPEFYKGGWQKAACEPHRIFLSQGDYPIKGLHYLLAALPRIAARFPDVQAVVAGNSPVKASSWRGRLGLSGYGRYLRRLLREAQAQDRVAFAGKLSARQMKEQYLRSGLYVCCSAMENSPNSLGEAMILGVPCVTADVGGIPSLFCGGTDGISYRGYRDGGITFYQECEMDQESDPMDRQSDRIGQEPGGSGQEPYGKESPPLAAQAERLAQAVLEIWSAPERLAFYSENARSHARRIHDREANYRTLLGIYARILGDS